MPKIIEDAERLILETAKQIYKEVGYQKASMRMIARASGVSSGTLYTYFEKKEILFCHVALELNLSVFGQMINELSQIKDPAIYIKRFLELKYYNYYKPISNISAEIENTEVEVTLDRFLRKSDEWEAVRAKTYKNLEESMLKINPELTAEDITRILLLIQTLSISFVRKLNDESQNQSNIDFIYRVTMNAIIK